MSKIINIRPKIELLLEKNAINAGFECGEGVLYLNCGEHTAILLIELVNEGNWTASVDLGTSDLKTENNNIISITDVSGKLNLMRLLIYQEIAREITRVYEGVSAIHDSANPTEFDFFLEYKNVATKEHFQILRCAVRHYFKAIDKQRRLSPKNENSLTGGFMQMQQLLIRLAEEAVGRPPHRFFQKKE